MKILSLEIEDILNMKAAYIEPSGAVVTVQGDNEAGKSSILDAIVYALESGRSLPRKAVRKGASKGKITIEVDGLKDDTGEYTIPPFTITRSLKDNGSASLSIKPTTALGGLTARKFLDQLIGNVSFDPLEFINHDEARQREVIMEIAGIDNSKVDADIQDLFDERAEFRRDRDEARVRLDGLEQHVDIKLVEEQSSKDLLNDINDAMVFNRGLTDREVANENLKDKALRIKDQVATNEKNIKSLQLQIQICEDDSVKMDAQVDKIREEYKAEKALLSSATPIDIETLQEQLGNIEGTNAKIRENIAYADASGAYDGMLTLYTDKNIELEAARQSKLDTIASATMPVPGLTFEDDSLFLDGVPLSQASDGRKLLVSLGISMALNPTLRILRVKDGSLLGPKNLELLSKQIEDNDYQLWIERVADKAGYDGSGKVGVFIEDGVVVEVDGKAPKKKPAKKPVKKVAKKAAEKTGGKGGKGSGKGKGKVEAPEYTPPEDTPDRETDDSDDSDW